MKQIQNLGIEILLLTLFIISSCKETPPYINLKPSNASVDTTYVSIPAPTPEQKNVVIEEFTGVRCPNCPKAQLEATKISDNNPGRINIITAHPLNEYNSLTTPFGSGEPHPSKYDFRTDAGAQIFNMTGKESGSLPIGNVNRKLHSGETRFNISFDKWSAAVTTELALPTPVNINVNANNTGDSISIECTLKYTESVLDSHYVSIFIIESGMVDVQESTDINGLPIYEENYVHRHVLRAVVTDYFGDLLKAKLEPGRVFYKKYKFKRDPAWVKTNLDVIASVHMNTTKKYVVHSKETPVK